MPMSIEELKRHAEERWDAGFFPDFPGHPAREPLAGLMHLIQSAWTSGMLSGLATRHPDGSVTIPPNIVARWDQRRKLPYEGLSPQELYECRLAADRVIARLLDAGFLIDRPRTEGEGTGND